MKGDLASFKNEEEQSNVDSSSDWYWIGLTDKEEEGKWVWSDGSNNVWQNWRGQEPNGGTEENCVAISHDGKWIDDGCFRPRFFVCKIPGAYLITQNYYFYKGLYRH